MYRSWFLLTLQELKTRKRYHFSLLRFCHLKDEGDEKSFTLILPNKKFLLQAKNPQSKRVWIEFIKLASGDLYKYVSVPFSNSQTNAPHSDTEGRSETTTNTQTAGFVFV